MVCNLDVGCEIQGYPQDNGCCHNRDLVRVAVPGNPRFFQPTIHYDCPENQLRAFVGRVASVVPKPSKEGIERLRAVAKDFGESLPKTMENDIMDMPKRYTGLKRSRYERACDLVMAGGVFLRDSYISMFVKPERFDGAEKRDPDPRAIQFRGAKFCVAIAQYLHPIEHHIYVSEFASDGVPRSRNIAKGLNSVERAELLKSKIDEFESPILLSLDASRWDKHVDVLLLMIEHQVYLASNPNSTFKWLLSKQLNNKCFSKLGLKYVVRGRRMSGDMNTACGNCLLMLIMLTSFCRSQSLRKWDCLDDGDDCLLIIEASDLSLVLATIKDEFLSYGMVLKVESSCDSLFGVIFCQSCVVEYSPGRFKFVRDYKKVISKALCGIRHWKDPRYRVKVLRAIGTCELVLNLGVPVLQAFALAVLRNCGCDEFDLKYAPDGLRARTLREARFLGAKPEKIVPTEIHQVARESFEQSFGLSWGDQLNLEEFLNEWEFDVWGLHSWGAEWSVHDWIPHFSCTEVYDQPRRQNAETQL